MRYRSRTAGHSGARGFHRGLRSHVLDDRVVPIFPILVSKDDVMC